MVRRAAAAVRLGGEIQEWDRAMEKALVELYSDVRVAFAATLLERAEKEGIIGKIGVKAILDLAEELAGKTIPTAPAFIEGVVSIAGVISQVPDGRRRKRRGRRSLVAHPWQQQSAVPAQVLHES